MEVEKMRHQTQEQRRKFDLQIAESVIKGMIKNGKVKESIELAEKKKISSERYGELVRIANNEKK